MALRKQAIPKFNTVVIRRMWINFSMFGSIPVASTKVVALSSQKQSILCIVGISRLIAAMSFWMTTLSLEPTHKDKQPVVVIIMGIYQTIIHFLPQLHSAMIVFTNAVSSRGAGPCRSYLNQPS